MLSTVLVAALTVSGVMAERLVTGAVGRRVESAERVDTVAIAEAAMLAFRKLSRMPVQVRATWLHRLHELCAC